MILNMVGANEVQTVDFTLPEDVDISLSEGLEIDNVYLPDGTYSEFAIFPVSSLSITNLTILYVISPLNISNVHQSGMCFVDYTSVGGYKFNTDNNIATYDATNKKFKIKSSGSLTFLRAGNYRLVIW